MRERPPSATSKEASLVRKVGNPAIVCNAVECNYILFTRILKEMFEDSFEQVGFSVDLHNFTDRARPGVIKIPTNAFAALVSKPHFAEGPSLLISSHELQEPLQQ